MIVFEIKRCKLNENINYMNDSFRIYDKCIYKKFKLTFFVDKCEI